MKKFLLFSVAIVFSLALFAQKGDVVVKNATPIKKITNQKVNKKVNPVLNQYRYDGVVIGMTNYDLQTNTSVAPRIRNLGGGAYSAVWTQYHGSDLSLAPERGTGYNYCTDVNDVTSWQYYDHDGNQTIESDRTGWPVLLANETDEFVASHVMSSPGFYGHTQAIGAAGSAWTQSNVDAGPEAMLWPRGASTGDNYYLIGVDNYENLDQSDIDGLHFYKSEDAGATWTYVGLMPDYQTYYSGGSGDTYAIDARDNYVAVVQFGDFADTRLWKSDDYGENWTQMVINDFPVDAYDGTAGEVVDMDDDGVADTLYTTDQAGDIIIDSEGKVHVVFSRMMYLDEDAGDDGAYSWFPYTDWLLYWNEDMGEGAYDASDMISESRLDMSVPDAVDTVGWCFDLNENGEFYEFPEVDAGAFPFGTYYTSVTSLASLAIDANDNIYVAFTTVMEGDNYVKENAAPNIQSFRHVWVRGLNNAAGVWGDPICISDEIANSENVYPSVAKNVTDGQLVVMYQNDNEPGVYLKEDAGEPVTDNAMVVKAIEVGEFVVGINEDITDINVSVYPNPTNDYVTVTNVNGAKISVINILGAEVFSTTSNEDNATIDMSNLPSGTYFVKVANENGTATKKVMKVK